MRPPSSTLFPYTTLFRSVLEATAADVVRSAVGEHFRNHEQRYSARAFRGVGQSRQNEMHDVVGERSEEHTSELQSHSDLVCRLLLEKKKHERRARELYHN